MTSLPSTRDSALTLDDGVAVLAFERDDVRNALTGTTLIDDIVDTIDWANRNREVRVLVLTSRGAAFSAGGNVKDMKARSGAFAEVSDRPGAPATATVVFVLDVSRPGTCSSSTAWKFVPPKPNALTAARRTSPPCASHSRSSVFTWNGVFTKSMFGLGRAKPRLGGSTLSRSA